jgi:hypothetical protein
VRNILKIPVRVWLLGGVLLVIVVGGYLFVKGSSSQVAGVVFGRVVLRSELSTNKVKAAQEFAVMVEQGLIDYLRDTMSISVDEKEIQEYLARTNPEIVDLARYESGKEQITEIVAGLQDILIHDSTIEETFAAHHLSRFMTLERWRSLTKSYPTEDRIDDIRKMSELDATELRKEAVGAAQGLIRNKLIRKKVCNLSEIQEQLKTDQDAEGRLSSGELNYACQKKANSYIRNLIHENVSVASEDIRNYTSFLTLLAPIG